MESRPSFSLLTMATLSLSSSSFLRHHSPQSVTASAIAVPRRSSFHAPPEILFSPINRHRSSLLLSNLCAKSTVCSAAVRPPPDSGPPPEKDPVPLKGFPVFLSKFGDRVQIFFAVLFWMSLFFWTSALDGKNRPNKGSRFRR